ncbi:MAG: hydrogenase nickel incorporation protein HypB [Eubacteriales bacterium]|nr:hydrogenase nickel incorporation protein HypB [Eubacteriales bacterium]
MPKVIQVNQSVYAVNDAIADEVRAKNQEHHTVMLNVMASPGAGKTTLLLKTLDALKGEYRIGVMEADIESSVDADIIEAAGVRAIQVHTGGECAMDAEMTLQAIEEFHTENLDLLILENVGNLVCPAETDTGADKKVVLLSVPEGDDKPLKYPLMFEVADIVLITKIDTKPYFTFNEQAVIDNIRLRNKHAEILFVSAKKGDGMDRWLEWLKALL